MNVNTKLIRKSLNKRTQLEGIIRDFLQDIQILRDVDYRDIKMHNIA